MFQSQGAKERHVAVKIKMPVKSFLIFLLGKSRSVEN